MQKKKGMLWIVPLVVATADSLLQKRNGIEHINLVDFMRKGKNF